MTASHQDILRALQQYKPQEGGGFSDRESRQMFNAGQDVVGPAFDSPAVKLNTPDFTNAELFAGSMFSAMTKELVGSTPSPEIQQFRAENPIAGGISWMLGATPFFLLPQVGAVRGASAALPGFTKALNYAEKLKDAGSFFRGGALMEATRFAPLETARIGGSLLNPQEGSTPRTLAAAGGELGFLGVLGGAGSTISARLKHLGFERLRAADDRLDAAREKVVSDHIGPGFDKSASIQDKWNVLKEWRNKKDFDDLPIRLEIEELMARYEARIKTGEPPEITRAKTVKDPRTGKDVQEKVTKRTRYVANMGSSAATQRVESLYEFGKKTGRGAKGIVSRIMRLDDAPGFGGFHGEGASEALTASLEGWAKVVEQAGLSKVWQGITQYPRELQPGSAQAKERLLQILQQDFKQIGDDTWYAREAAEGLYVGVKRLKGGGARDAKGRFIGDRYYIFKTNKPSRWFKGESNLHDTLGKTFLEGTPAWNMVEQVPDAAVPTLATVRKTWGMQNPANASLHGGHTRKSSDPNTSAEASHLRIFWERMFPQSFVESTVPFFDATSQLARRAKHFIGSQRLQAANNPRLQNIIMSTAKIFEAQAARASDIILGPIADEFIRTGSRAPLASIFRVALKPDKRRKGGTQALFRELLNSESALKDFNAMRIAGMTADDAAKAGLSGNAVKLARELEVVDDMLAKEIANQAKALGMENTFVPRKGHFTIANTWVGPFRVALKDANSTDIVGFASGFSREQAGAEAVRLTELINSQAIARGEGKQLLTYSRFEGKSPDLPLNDHIVHAGSEQAFKDMVGLRALQKHLGLEAASTDASARQADIFGFATQINLANPLVETLKKARTNMYLEEPKRFLKSKGFLGARGTENVPFSLKELETTHAAGVIESLRYLAREAVAHGPMSDQIKLLAIENAGDAVTFNRIFNSMNGVSGPVSRAVERGIDAVLADVVGPGSAVKMVRATNEAMFLLTLGAFDMGFAALNLITPLQTAIPEVSFILGAAPETLQRYYSNALIQTAKGGVKPVSFLDTLRFARVAADDLLRPDQSTRAALARAFDEHVVGRDFVETVHGGMRSIAEGEGGIWRHIQRWSEAPVVATEEASRSYSFLLGRRVAKDFFDMGEEEAFQFARQFVQHTMFGYGAGDRPRVLTGALGAGWGLFKNWTMNYTGNLIRYGSEATRGNFNPLMWAGATTGAVGGLAAMPLAGMADGMAEFATDKTMNDLVYDMVGNDPGDKTKPWAADFLAHGFPSLLGFTLRSRASAPSSHLMTDITMFGNIAMMDRAVALKESIGTFIEDATDFRLPMQNPAFRRELMRAFAPRTIQRAVTGFGVDALDLGTWGDRGGLQSLKTGNVLMPALGIREGVFNSFGLTPVSVANTFEIQQEAWKDSKQKRETIQLLGKRLADASLNRDWDEVRRLQTESLLEGVPMDSVNRSAMQRVRNQQEPFLTRQFKDRITRQRLKNRGL